MNYKWMSSVLLVVLAIVVAVEAGVTTFEQPFLPSGIAPFAHTLIVHEHSGTSVAIARRQSLYIISSYSSYYTLCIYRIRTPCVRNSNFCKEDKVLQLAARANKIASNIIYVRKLSVHLY